MTNSGFFIGIAMGLSLARSLSDGALGCNACVIVTPSLTVLIIAAFAFGDSVSNPTRKIVSGRCRRTGAAATAGRDGTARTGAGFGGGAATVLVSGIGCAGRSNRIEPNAVFPRTGSNASARTIAALSDATLSVN